MREWLIRIAFVGLVCAPSLGYAEEAIEKIPMEKIQVLKISPQDERAVVKVPGGKLQVIKVGDPIGDKGGRVVEIADGRVVVEEGAGREEETIIIRIADGKQRIERLKKDPGERPLLFAPKEDEGDRRMDGGSSLKGK